MLQHSPPHKKQPIQHFSVMSYVSSKSIFSKQGIINNYLIAKIWENKKRLNDLKIVILSETTNKYYNIFMAFLFGTS